MAKMTEKMILKTDIKNDSFYLESGIRLRGEGG